MGKQILITFIATLGGFLGGSDIGIVSKIQTYFSFEQMFMLTSMQLGLMVAVMLLGCLNGSLLSSYIAESLGRKKSILLGSVVFTCGLFLQVLSSGNYTIFLCGRFTTGLALGILVTIVPMYLGEVVAAEDRGMVVSCQHLACGTGTFVGFMVSYFLEEVEVFGLKDWQFAIILQLIPNLLMLFGMLTLPESPRYLITKHKFEAAKKALANLRSDTLENVETELQQLKSNAEEEQEQLSLGQVLNKYKSRLLTGILVQVFQQISGFNGLMYFSAALYKGMMPEYADYLAGGQTLMNIVATIPGMLLIDRLGRRTLMLFGTAGCSLGLFITGTAMLLPVQLPLVAVCGVFFFITNYAYSLGPVPWVVCAEIYPAKIRSKAISITTSANWLSNLIISFISPILLDSIGPFTFYIFSLTCLTAYFWVLKTLPETKGMSLEQVNRVFAKK